MIALRTDLFGACAEYHFPVEHDLYARSPVKGRVAERVDKVRFRICDITVDGLLRTGEYDGLWGILYQIGKGCGCIGHSIRAMQNNESVIRIVAGTDRIGDGEPMYRRHVRAVDTAYFFCIYIDRVGKSGDEP